MAWRHGSTSAPPASLTDRPGCLPPAPGGRRGDEPVEHRQRVERAGGALGVVLDGLDRQLAVTQALDRAVVEVDLADVEAAGRRERVGDDLDLVVLGRHLDPAGVDVADRVVRPVMAEPEPARLGAGRPPDDLVAEADPEERAAVGDRRPRQRDRTGEPRRVARPGRQDEPVDLGGQRVPGADGVGQDPDPGPAPTERADDVRLEPVVDDRDERPALGRVADLARRLRRDEVDEVLVLPARERAGRRPRRPPGRSRPARSRVPGIEPCVRRCRASARVSIPAIAGIPSSRRSAASWAADSTTAAVALATTRARSQGCSDWSSSRSRP